jgi:hypothetical protein
MRRWWAWGQWVVIPLVMFGMAELLVRHAIDHRPRWYGAAEQAVAAGLVDVIFVGSSRVRAAVHVPTFEEEVLALGGSCVRTLNLGRGYSTAAEHYLGLRNLFATHPEHLPAVTVFVEIPSAPLGPAHWSDSWSHEEQPWMLVDLIGWGDLWSFWRSRGLPWTEKIHLSVRFSLREVAVTFNRRERIREGLMRDCMSRVLQATRPRATPPNDERSSTSDLIGRETEIRTDPASIQAARNLALQITAEWVDREIPTHDWRESVQRDLVEMVERRGGRVMFFMLPQSSVFARLENNPGRQRDMQNLTEHARRWNTDILSPHVEFSDEDLPDLWHVSHNLARSFSRELARDWLKTGATGAPAGGATPIAADRARAARRSISCPRP